MNLIYAILFASSLTLLFYLGKVLVKRKIQQNKDSVSTASLDKELWTLTSKYVRSKDADWKGFVSCYTCGTQYEWKYTDCGHCIPKSTTGSYLKFDLRNLRPQCKICNQVKGGMRKEFEQKLKLEYGENIISELMKLKDKSLTIQEYKDRINYLKFWLKSH